MTTPTIVDGTSDTDLGSLYAVLVSGGAQAFAGVGSGPKVLEMTSSVIQTASLGNGLSGEINDLMAQDLPSMLAADVSGLINRGTAAAQANSDVAVGSALYNAATQAVDAAALAIVQNNASLLADIAQYCTANNITVEVEAVMTPPAANGVVIVPGTTITATEPYVGVWATAAAYAALPISAIEDIQEAGTGDYYQEQDLPQLPQTAAMEAIGVSTLLSDYQAIAQNDLDAGAQPAGQVAVASQAAIAQAYSQVVSNLAVGDAEANDVAYTTVNVLQDVAAYWNDYDSVVNGGTATVYGWVEDNAGTVTDPFSQTYLPSEEMNLPPNETITRIWSNGTWAPGGAAAVAQIDPNVTVFLAGTTDNWDYEINGAGPSATALYGIFKTTTISQGVTTSTLTFVSDPQTVTLAAATPDFSFVTADLGAGQDAYDWLSAMAQLASGGTITVGGTNVSIGNNPTLALGEWNQGFLQAFTNRQAVELSEQQAIQIAGYGIDVSTIVNESWHELPVGAGLVSSPGSWTNADAVITATYSLYENNAITATGSIAVSIAAPGQLVLDTGSPVALGNMSLNYAAADASTARLAVVLIDQTGTFTVAGRAGGTGTFGTSGTFAGAGSNVLVLNGTTADLDRELNAIDLTENNAGPDTVDIQAFGASGPLSDNQISVLAQAANVSDNAIQATSNLQGWIAASAQLNNGTIASEVLNWNTSGILASNVGTATAGQVAFVRTDLVHTTLNAYDVVQQPNGMRADSTALITNVDDNASGGAAPSFDDVTALTVGNTTNTFDTAGNLAQSVDVLLAPVNTNGTDGATLAQWGTEVTEYNTGDNQAWQAGWGSQFASVTLTYTNSRQLVEEVLQGGASDPNFVIDNVYDPATGALWEQFQSTPPPEASSYTLATFVTEFNQTDNPFWLPGQVGTDATQSFTQLALNTQVTVPTSADFLDASTVAYNVSLSATGSGVALVTPNQFVNGTILDFIDLPNAIDVNLNSLGLITVDSQTFNTALSGLNGVDADEATGNVTITGLLAGDSTLIGGNDVTNITGYGHDTLIAGDGTTTIGSGGDSAIFLTGATGAEANISSDGGDKIVDSGHTNISLDANNETITLPNVGESLNLIGGTGNTARANGDTIQAAGHSSVNVYGSNNTFTLANAGVTLGMLGGSGNTLSASGDTIAALWDNTFTLSGSNNGIIFGSSGNTVTVLAGTSNTMLANGETIQAAGQNTINVSGGNNTCLLESARDMLGLLGGTGNTISANDDTIAALGNNSFTLSGSNNGIVFGGPGDSISLVSGTDDTMLANDETIQDLDQNSINLFGSDNSVSLASSGDVLGLLGGSGNAVTANGALIRTVGLENFAVSGSNNNIFLDGAGNTVALGGGTGNAIQANGSTITSNAGATTTVFGSSDTVNFGSNSKVVLSYSGSIGFITGSKDTNQLIANTNAQVDYGFNAANGDAIDLSEILTGHDVNMNTLENYLNVTNSGSDTILGIAGNSGPDTVTLVGVGALSLQTMINDNVFVMPTH